MGRGWQHILIIKGRLCLPKQIDFLREKKVAALSRGDRQGVATHLEKSETVSAAVRVCQLPVTFCRWCLVFIEVLKLGSVVINYKMSICWQMNKYPLLY